MIEAEKAKIAELDKKKVEISTAPTTAATSSATLTALEAKRKEVERQAKAGTSIAELTVAYKKKQEEYTANQSMMSTGDPNFTSTVDGLRMVISKAPSSTKVEIGTKPANSATAFEGAVQQELGKTYLVIKQVIKEPYLPNSYGSFQVTVLDNTGSRLASLTIQVNPAPDVRLSKDVYCLKPDGTPLKCSVYVNVIKGPTTWDLVFNGETDAQGRAVFPEKLADGTYILGIAPATNDFASKEIKLVVALGLLRPTCRYNLPNQNPSYNPIAGTSMNPNVRRDTYGNAIGKEGGMIREGGLRGLNLAFICLCSEVGNAVKFTAEMTRIGIKLIRQDSFPFFFWFHRS